MLLLEQLLAPGGARRDAARLGAGERLLDIEEGIEGAADLGQLHAGDRGERLGDEVAPLLEGAAHLGHALLRPGERGDGRMLAHTARIARLLALQVADRLRQRLRTDRPPDSPAGHRVGLAHARDDHGAVGEAGPERRERRRLAAVEHELVVDLVGHDGKVGLDRDVGQDPQLIGRIDHAGGVARRTEQKHPRLGREGGPQRLRTQLEIVGNAGFQEHRPGPGEFDQFGVAHPIRRGHDHLVSLVQERHERVVERVLGAVGDDDLRRRDRKAGSAGIVGGHRLAQVGNAGGGGVFRFARADRRFGRLADVGRGGEVGLTHR